MTSPDDDTLYWTVAEAARIAGKSYESILRAIRSRRLKAYAAASDRRSYRLLRADVQAWLTLQLVKPTIPQE